VESRSVIAHAPGRIDLIVYTLALGVVGGLLYQGIFSLWGL